MFINVHQCSSNFEQLNQVHVTSLQLKSVQYLLRGHITTLHRQHQNYKIVQSGKAKILIL